jgi:tetratricopeptide (TPR) repeat protein
MTLGNMVFMRGARASGGEILNSSNKLRSTPAAQPTESFVADAVEVTTTSTGICAALFLPQPLPHLLAQDAESMQNLQEAHIKKLAEKLRVDSTNIVVRSQLANKLAVMGRYQAAVSHLEKLLSQPLSSRNRWAVLNNYGNLHFLRDSLQQAEVYYQRALQADSSAKETYLNLGTLYTALDDTATAIAMYEQVVKDSTEAAQVEKLLGLSEEEERAAVKASSQDSKKKKTKNLKEKVKSNIRKAAGRKVTRPGGKKGVELGAGGYEGLEGILYWAEVK